LNFEKVSGEGFSGVRTLGMILGKLKKISMTKNFSTLKNTLKPNLAKISAKMAIFSYNGPKKIPNFEISSIFFRPLKITNVVRTPLPWWFTQEWPG